MKKGRHDGALGPRVSEPQDGRFIWQLVGVLAT